MTLQKQMKTLKSCAAVRCLPPILLAVSLSACSELLADLDKTSLVAAEKPQAVVASAAKTDAQLPDMPGYIATCLNRAPHKAAGKKGKDGKQAAPSADDKVVALKKTADDRQACGQAAVAWYKNLQKANGKAAEPAAKKAGG